MTKPLHTTMKAQHIIKMKALHMITKVSHLMMKAPHIMTKALHIMTKVLQIMKNVPHNNEGTANYKEKQCT